MHCSKMRNWRLYGALVVLLSLMARGWAADEAPRPATAQTLPEGTFLYVHLGSWNNWGNGWDQTNLSKICAEPEVRTFVAGPLDKLSQLLNKAVGGDEGAAPAKEGQTGDGMTVGKIFQKLGQVMPGPTTLVMKYSKDDQQNKRPPSVALVTGAKDLGEDLQRTITNVLKQIMPEKEFSPDRWTRRVQFILAEVNDLIREGTGKGVVVEQHGQADLRILPVDRFTITITLHRQNLILSSDKELCKQILDGLAGTLPNNLAADKTYAACGLAGDEHLAAYLDVKILREALSLEQPAPRIQEMLLKAGLDDLHAAAWSLRMQGQAFESRTALVSDKRRGGILGALDSEPLTADALRIARPGSPELVALRVRGEEIGNIVRGVLENTAGSEAAQRFDKVAAKLSAEGRDLKKEMAAAFTGELAITRYAGNAAPVGAISTELGLAMTRDEAKADALMLEVMKRMVAERVPAEKFEAVFKEQEFEGARIRYLVPPAGQKGLPPVFAHVGRGVLVALDMQTLKAGIKDLKSPALADSDAFKAGLSTSGGKLGAALYYNDWRQRYINVFDVSAKTLKLAATFDLLRGPGIDVNLLPTPECVARHLFPSVTSVQASDTALVLSSRSPLPSPEVIAPPIAACVTVFATLIPESKAAPAEKKQDKKEEVKKAE